MENLIYYFSGTGNSLYAASQLGRRLPDSRLVPMVPLLETGEISPQPGSIVGLVFPIHRAGLPLPVRDFAEKLKAGGCYVFALATRAGTTHRAFGDLDRVLGRSGTSLSAAFNINMPSNDPKFAGFRPPTEEEMERIENSLQETLDSVKKVVLEGKKYRKRDIERTMRIPVPILWITPLISRMVKERFHVTADCAGCEICEAVCPSSKIRTRNYLPVWLEDIECFSCYACLNFCPVQAVQIKSTRTEENGRYTHPEVTAEEIGAQRSTGV